MGLVGGGDKPDLEHNLVTDADTTARDEAHHARHICSLVTFLKIRLCTRWAQLMIKMVHFGVGPLADPASSTKAASVK